MLPFSLSHYKKLAFFGGYFAGLLKNPPQIDVIFPTPVPSILIFSLFPFHCISFQKSQKRNSVKEKENENDETVSGSAQSKPSATSDSAASHSKFTTTYIHKLIL
jgi:hypothetical protein